MTAASIPLHRIGEINLSDLAAVCALQGLDGLPYPFFSRAWLAESTDPEGAGAATIRDRLADGDLRCLRDWVATYSEADIWVGCQVHDVAAGVPTVRIAAHRVGEAGFFATQHPEGEAVEVFSVSPYEIGAAIAASAGLSAPGAHPRVVIPGFPPAAGGAGKADGAHRVAVPVVGPRPPAGVVVPEADVTAMGTVQSRCEPSRRWGLDPGREWITWVRVGDDGDYLYAPDRSHVAPVTAQLLRTRIDGLIAADIAVLRRQRAEDA